MTRMRIPNPGESKSNYFNRDFVKAVSNLAQQSSGNHPSHGFDNNDTIAMGRLLSISSVDTIPPFTAIGLSTGPLIPRTSDNLHLRSKIVECLPIQDIAQEQPTWGVTLDFVGKGRPGRVQLSGICWVNTTSGATMTGPSLDVIEGQLRGGYGGRGLALNGITTPHALISLGTPNPIKFARTNVTISSTPVDVELLKFDLSPSTKLVKARTIGPDITVASGYKNVMLVPFMQQYIALEICG